MRGSPGRSRWRTVGIIGGMGPAATVDFMARLVAATPASTDQQHIPVVVWSDPTVPDRVAAARRQGASPVPWMRAGVEGVTQLGAQVVAVACNTAHAFLEESTAGVDVEVVSMVDASAVALAALGADLPAPPRALVLGTRGLLEVGLYQDALAAEDLGVLVPDEAEQARLSALILRVKAAEPAAALAGELAEFTRAFAARGATHVLLACTELSLLASEAARTGVEFALPVVDASDELARAVVRAAGR